MSDQMQNGMAETTRLVREGRLNEGAAVIQGVLGGTVAPVTELPRSGAVVEYRPADTTKTSQPVTDRGPAAATRPAPEPPLRFRGVPRLADSLLGLMPGVTEDVPASSVIPEGGRFVERSYTNQAGSRSYKLYIPSGYTGQAVPLVVMLHGCTQVPDDFAAGTQMNVLAETQTFLVAYPRQANNANMSKCWNWFKAADQQRGQGEPSLIAGITRQVVEEYGIDADRVYVAGMSAGGAMAAIMGAAYPDLYAAIGVHSGLAPGAAHDLSSAFAAMQNGGPTVARWNNPTSESTQILPTIVFHGDRDTTVHPKNADQLLAHFAAANTADVRDTTRGSALQTTTDQGQVRDGHAYTYTTYHDAGGRALIEQWTIHELGHAWSGGSLHGSYTDPHGPDASMKMVRFFNQHPQRESM